MIRTIPNPSTSREDIIRFREMMQKCVKGEFTVAEKEQIQNRKQEMKRVEKIKSNEKNVSSFADLRRIIIVMPEVPETRRIGKTFVETPIKRLKRPSGNPESTFKR